MNLSVRPAAVAGGFYPGSAAPLAAALQAHLRRAVPRAEAAPKLLVVPHAGYVYSGDSAGRGYATLVRLRGRIERVVLLGPAHRVAFRGLALPAVQAFETPLGRVEIDRDAQALLKDLPQVLTSDRAHAQEHSLEVQLPFLQTVLGSGWRLVPLVVGDARAEEVDAVVERLWGGDETLVVVSSDLSHYLDDDAARARDRRTVERILACADDLRSDEACGARALNGAMRAARRHGLQPRLLDQRTSADSPRGDRERVVGYAAIAFAAPGPAGRNDRHESDAALGRALLASARAEIAGALGLPQPPAPDHPRLHEPGACFVTLHDAAGKLRGCVGRLQAERLLAEDVRRNALAAAFGDSRFRALTAPELAGLSLEVSLLGPLEPLPEAASLEQAAAMLAPGDDGVLLEWNGHRGTFLPQVWHSLPDARDFLQALLVKAGLKGRPWPADARLSRYRVTAWDEAQGD